MIRALYRLLSVAGDVKAGSRGLGPLARRQGRKVAHRQLARVLRRVLKP